MFEGRYGVTVAIVPVDSPSPFDMSDVKCRQPGRLGELLPVSKRTAADIADELGRISTAEAQLAGYKAELVAGLSRLRPDSLDRASGSGGSGSDRWVSGRACLPGVSEFFSDELAMILNSGRMYAGALAVDCVTVVDQLPQTHAAVADGVLDWSRARILAEMLGERPASVIAAVEAEVVPEAAGLSLRLLRARIHKVLIRIDAIAAHQRFERAARAADVFAYPTEDGMGVLTAELPYPLASACRDALDTYARMVKRDGDERPIGQIRAGVLSDLILRPWDTSRPAVTANISLLVPLPVDGWSSGDIDSPTDVAEVDGVPITSEQCQALLDQLGARLPGASLQTPPGGSLDIVISDSITGAQRAVSTLSGLHRAARSGGLGSPGHTEQYEPTGAQDRFVRRRDRTCRFPSCARTAVVCDVDHNDPWPAGATTCRNLCCLCRRHHRLKTHSPGWRFKLLDDATLIVTTPSGVTRTTRPPGLRSRPTRQPAQVENDPPPF